MTRKSGVLQVVILRVAFFACIVLLVALSWLPAPEMVRTGISGRMEHGVAYFGTTVIMGLAYRAAPRLLVQSALLVALAAILEAGQLQAPGRNASLHDFASGSAGVALGGLLIWRARPRILGWLGMDRGTSGP